MGGGVRKCDESTRHVCEQEHVNGGVGNAGIATRRRGDERGIKGIWKRKGLSSDLNIHPELQADMDSKWAAQTASPSSPMVHGARTFWLRPDSVIRLGVTSTPR